MSQNREQIIDSIKSGRTALGIEFGSTRIKAVLIDETMTPIAQGNHDWENQFEQNVWTYSMTNIMEGLKTCYFNLSEDVKKQYGETLTTIGSIGVSAMMHGYMAFDKDGGLLVPFRTWRNTITQEAAEKLTELFHYNIPQRWSIAHLEQAILNDEAHVKNINFLTTLSGFIHYKLTGEKVLGVGDASGMFPIDTNTGDYHASMLKQFDDLTAPKGYSWKLSDILPKVLTAGENAGVLTEEGARLLDASGTLKSSIPLCPPEGDAGTGMTATNSVEKRTGNVSAGTSVFIMAVLEKELSKVYPEIDLVTTPSGNLVGMVHCNNCTSDLNAWVNIFEEFSEAMGIETDRNNLFGTLYNKALTGDADCGGLLSYCYLSGEPVTGFEEGRPLFVRTPESKFNLANFMRTHLYSSLAALKIGMDIMFKEEGVVLDNLMGHGGFFKTKGVGQRVMAAAASAPVSVMETAGEGGAWGIALLASYMAHREEGESLSDFLNHKVFTGDGAVTIAPVPEDVVGFDAFITQYKEGLAAERAAVNSIKLQA